MDDCGRLAVRDTSLCEEHLQDELRSLAADIKRHERCIEIARERVATLTFRGEKLNG
jgi:hypothetical protein